MNLKTLARAVILDGRSLTLKGVPRAHIFVGGGNATPAARTDRVTLVGTGTRLVPTVYQELRAQRRRRRTLMVLAILAPTLVASVYYGLIASDRYVSHTQMVLSNQNNGISSLGGEGGGGKNSLFAMLGIGGNDQTNEYAIITNYLASSEAMIALDNAIGLKKRWSAHAIDYFSRLPPDASQEEFLRYYRDHVTVISDPAEPVVEMEIEAFDPRDAQLIGSTLVRLAQEKLESAFVGMREDSLRFGESQLQQAEDRLGKTNEEMKRFRNAHRDLDPSASAKGVGTVTMGLFAQLASAEAELRTTLSYARENAPAVNSLRARIEALKNQIAADRQLMAGNPADNPYSSSMSNYEDITLKQKFAQDAYATAIAYLAARRADLERRHAYLIDYLAPTLPDETTEPRRARNVLIVFIASVLMWLTGSLVLSALREHASR